MRSLFQAPCPVLAFLAEGFERRKLITDAAHELEDGLLLLGELPEQASAQQVLLLGRGRGNFLGLAVERGKQGPGLGQVPCHGLP